MWKVAAADLAITASRMEALLEIAVQAGFNLKQTAFVTAFSDRRGSAYRKLAPELAWGSFAWFVSEPDKIVVLKQSGKKKSEKLFELI